jgi:hypothetical protein
MRRNEVYFLANKKWVTCDSTIQRSTIKHLRIVSIAQAAETVGHVLHGCEREGVIGAQDRLVADDCASEEASSLAQLLIVLAPLAVQLCEAVARDDRLNVCASSGTREHK